MSTVARPRHARYSLAEYLWAEEQSKTLKHEYVDGEMVAMAGSTVEHAALTSAVGIELGVQLSGPCRTYSPDLHIWIEAAQLATYPDVAVVCDPVERHRESPLLVTNPMLLVEVLSPSTEDVDAIYRRAGVA